MESRTGKTFTTKEEITGAIIAYLEENTEEFNDLIEALDSWDGYLDGNRVFNMEDFDEIMCGEEPHAIALMIFNGYDSHTFVNQWGREEHEAFNPNQPYFKFNGYGNLVSLYEKDYSAQLDGWFVEDLAESWNRLNWSDDELEELLYIYQNIDNGEEE